MPFRFKVKTFGLILVVVIVLAAALISLAGYYSVYPKVLPDSRIVHADEEGLDIVVIHLSRSGWFDNYLPKVTVGEAAYRIYNSTHLVDEEGRYLKYVATGVVSVVEKSPYGLTFTIGGRGEPYDGYITFWGGVLSEEEVQSGSVEVTFERVVLWMPSRTFTVNLRVERIPEIESGRHPRVFYSEEDLSELKALVSGGSDNPMGVSLSEVFSQLRDMADGFLTESHFSVYGGRMTIYLPPNQPRRHTDNFPYWTGISRELQARLEVLAFMYLVTGDRAYAERAKAFMLYISNWNQWTDPDYRCAGPRTCLDIGHLSMGMALAYDWIYDTLDEAERFLVREALISKGIIPAYTEATEPGSWLQNPWRWPNGYAIVISGLGIASLVLLDEEPRAEVWLETAVNWTVRWLDRMGADGGYTEGHTYATYATDFTARFLYALLKDRSVNLFDHPYMRNVPYFALYSISPDGESIVNFEDASYGAVNDWKEPLAIAASLHGNRYAQWYLKRTGAYGSILRSHTYNTIYHFIGFNPEIEPLDPDGRLPPSRAFTSIGWAVFRTGWKENDTLFAFKCGPWGSHHHRDAADFVLNYQGIWLAAAPGYRLSTSTEAHNTLLIGGKGQGAADGRLIGFYNSSLVDYVGGDASETYGDGVTFIRQVLFVRPGLFIISDHVEAEGETSASWLLHAEPYSVIETSDAGSRITRRGKVLVIEMGSPQEVSVSTGRTEDLPYVRYDVGPSRRVRFLASLNPILAGEDEASVEMTFFEDCSSVNFTAPWGVGVAVFAEFLNHSTVSCWGLVSDGHVSGYIEKNGEMGYFLVNGSFLERDGQLLIRLDKYGYGAITVGSYKVVCEFSLKAAGWVGFYSPAEPIKVREGELEVPYIYDPASKVVRLVLEAGYHRLTVEFG